ncbi:hypothetical protein EDB89DRAFT_2184858 [Lactarius sanguifluus]|nr:hypothetical protein EDB89DRAFT_2184858 [Lactarius sanguifluus]
MKLAHSHHTSLRRMAASNIAKLFKAFLDLEKDAINAVYDLCEGQDPNVHRAGNITHRLSADSFYFVYRYESGYKAIVQMSEEQPRWLERKVDVGAIAVERFADEPEEVAVVKVALPTPRAQLQDEDKTIRERLRALVVAFLAQDAWKPLLAQLQGQGHGAAEQEDALIDSLIKAPGTITPSLLLRIDALAGSIQILRSRRGEDILLFLPSFNDGRRMRRGNELVHLLLARAASTLREDLEAGRNPASLEPPIPRQERLL